MATTYEARRYERMNYFRTKDVEDHPRYKPNPLYRRPQPWQVDGGVEYYAPTLRGKQFKSVDEALEEVRKLLDG